jgi:uncharacterized protein (UPF0261 family)
MTRPKVLLIVTQDTKHEEGAFLRQCLEAANCQVIHLDPSVRRVVGGAEIGPEAIAVAAGQTIEEVRALGHEGRCQAVMIRGSIKLALELHAREGLSGILAIGGSMGTTLASSVMQAFPYGLPKLLISTMASGFTAPFVGVKDITMHNAVCDIYGLNSISTLVYRNGAYGLAGMAHAYVPTRDTGKPLVLVSTLGTTEAAAHRLRELLASDGYEVMVFHTTGGGGRTLDAIAAERDVAAIVDMSLVEINDYLYQGICSAGPERATAGLKRGIPTIFVPGNCDFIIAGPIEDARKRFPGKRYHVHNPALTAVRTEEAELAGLAAHLATITAEATGPVRFFVPMRGFSHHDSPHGHIHDPSLPPVFARQLENALEKRFPIVRIDAHINDDKFVEALHASVRELTDRELVDGR